MHGFTQFQWGNNSYWFTRDVHEMKGQIKYCSGIAFLKFILLPVPLPPSDYRISPISKKVNKLNSTMVIAKITEKSVIILRYTTLCYNWVLRSDIHLSLLHNVKKSVSLKFKIVSITCSFHVFDMVLTLHFS